MADERRDLYEVLGVARNASDNDSGDKPSDDITTDENPSENKGKEESPKNGGGNMTVMIIAIACAAVAGAALGAVFVLKKKK